MLLIKHNECSCGGDATLQGRRNLGGEMGAKGKINLHKELSIRGMLHALPLQKRFAKTSMNNPNV